MADDEAVTVRTGQTLTVSPLVGDVDADGDQLIITAHDFEGEGQITYQVSDGRGGEDMGRIFVTVHSSGDTGGPGDGGPFDPDPCTQNPQLCSGDGTGNYDN